MKEVGTAATDTTRAAQAHALQQVQEHECQGKRQGNSRQGLGELINIARRRVEGER